MRLKQLVVENLLSFEHFDLALEEPATFVVGPNGSGKTNLVRAIGLLGTALRWAAYKAGGPWVGPQRAPGPDERELERYIGLRHRGGEEPASVRLAVALEGERERSLVASFVRAALAWALLDDLRGGGEDFPERLDRWAATVTEEKLACLSNGQLVLAHSGLPGRGWDLGFEFELPLPSEPPGSARAAQDGEDGEDPAQVALPSDEGAPGQESAPERWRWSLVGHPPSDHIVRLGADGRPTTTPVTGTSWFAGELFGIPRNAPANVVSALPYDLPAFELAKLLSAGTAGPVVLGQGGRTLVDLSRKPIRDFLAAFEPALRPAGTQGGFYGQAEPSTYQSGSWSLAHVLSRLWEESVTVLGEALRGIGPWGRSVPAAGLYRWSELAGVGATTEPYLLPARLALLKMSGPAAKDRYERVKELFGELAGDSELDVAMRPIGAGSLQGSRQVGTSVGQAGAGASAPAAPGPAQDGPATEGTGTDVEVEVLVSLGPEARRGDLRSPALPVQLCGAGVWEALLLAEALAGPPEAVVLLDEPASNVHWSWQQHLRDAFTNAEAQLVVVTHSASVVPLEQRPGAAVVRVALEDGASRAWSVAAGTWAAVGAKLRAKGNERLLFVEQAVLCEGQDDVGVVSAISERYELHLEDLRSTVVDCGGKGNLPAYVKLCDELGVKRLVVMDADKSKAAANQGPSGQTEAVRCAAKDPSEELFEFDEDIEHAFGLECKDSAELLKRAKEGDIKGGGWPEAKKLLEKLEKFAGQGH